MCLQQRECGLCLQRGKDRDGDAGGFNVLHRVAL